MSAYKRSVHPILLIESNSVEWKFIHQNVKSERKIEANSLTKQMKSCKPLPITIYDLFWYKPVDIKQ